MNSDNFETLYQAFKQAAAEGLITPQPGEAPKPSKYTMPQVIPSQEYQPSDMIAPVGNPDESLYIDDVIATKDGSVVYHNDGYDPNCHCAYCSKQKSHMEDTMATPTEEFAFVMYKPDAFERGLVGELMQLVDDKGPKLVAAKTLTMTPIHVEQHYSHHLGKDFWNDMVEFYTSGPTMACVYKGPQANEAIRTLIGNKHPSDSPPGSIRGKYATSFPKNLIHGSDTKQDAAHEMKHFFTDKEITDFKKLAKTI